MKVPYDISDNSYEVVYKHKFGNNNCVTDISWYGDRLLAATSDGSVFFFPIESLQMPFLISKENITEYIHERIKNVVSGAAVPGKMVSNSRINRVLINPTDNNLFLTLENLNLHIWDLEQVEEPILSKKGSNAPNFAAEWSPHVGNKFMIGGASKSLKLLDLRMFDSNEQKPIVWKHDNAHAATIRDIKWNPFVPHWVASCGDDCDIHIWDLRFGKQPVLTLQDHSNAINKICWSLTHCDMLVSGANDRLVKLWNINITPHHVLATLPEATSSIVGVGISRAEPYMYFAAAADGSCVSAYLSEQFLQPLVSSRFTTEEEQQVETQIFFRDFSSAFEKAFALAEKYKAQNRFAEALAVLELCYERTPPDPEAEDLTSSDSNEDPVTLFSEELQQYSYYIPPNFPEDLSITADPSLMEKIEVLKLNLELQMFVEQGAIEQLLDREKEILDMLQRDKNSIPPALLRKVVKAMMSYDYLKALEVGEELSDLFAFGNWNDYMYPIARILLYPTIYEPPPDSTTSPAILVNSLLNQELVIDQLSFLRKFTKILWSADPKEEEQLISFVEQQKPKVILSATANRIYLHALLHRHRYDLFYLRVHELLKTVEGYPLHEVVSKLRVEGGRHLQLYLQHAQTKLPDSNKADTNKKSEHSNSATNSNSSNNTTATERYGAAALTIVNILVKCSALPSNISSLLPPTLNQITLDLENALLQKSNETSGKTQVTKEVKKLIAEIEKIYDPKDKDKLKSVTGHNQINELLVMLKTFLS